MITGRAYSASIQSRLKGSRSAQPIRELGALLLARWGRGYPCLTVHCVHTPRFISRIPRDPTPLLLPFPSCQNPLILFGTAVSYERSMLEPALSRLYNIRIDPLPSLSSVSSSLSMSWDDRGMVVHKGPKDRGSIETQPGSNAGSFLLGQGSSNQET